MRTRPHFEDDRGVSVSLPSTWNAKTKGGAHSIETQTDGALYEFKEMFSQYGLKTNYVQEDVDSKSAGKTLLEFLCRVHKKIDQPTWMNRIRDGFITVDGDVCTNPEMRVEREAFIEFVNYRANMETQTEVDREADAKKSLEPVRDEELTDNQLTNVNYSKLNAFLRSAGDLMCAELVSASGANDVFEMVEFSSANESSAEVLYWKMLSVDLEKRKVLFPDWTNARHFPGYITKASLTRNKERVYTVEYDDGVVLQSVREEYIRLLSDPHADTDQRHGGKHRRQNASAASASSVVNPNRLLEGVRVHAKVQFRNGVSKFMPGRIVRAGKGTFDVEVEGGKVEKGLAVDDLIIGLMDGQQVEARKPNKMTLQCTGLSWNCTGNLIAASYGRNDITGWCDFPGAVCCWNISGKHAQSSEPDVVLDHTACLMCVAYHPDKPAVLAAGSFNGELLVWDLSVNTESAIAISPIIEYSHKEPIMSLQWVYDSTVQTYLLLTVGADGKVLYWDYSRNGLQHPVKGVTLKRAKESGVRRFENTFIRLLVDIVCLYSWVLKACC